MKLTKKRGRFLSIVTAAALLFSSLAPVSASEADPNTSKEEVVYINLHADGTVREINVVNIFDPDESGTITDYGTYQSLRNMTTTDPINYSDDTVTIQTSAEKLYYEGKLERNVMPWNISVHYYMDGTEYTGEEIAGMSGAFKMTIDIGENASCTGNFFDEYALQASVTLDTDRFQTISAPDATIANSGNDKQLTYTLLPGKGAEIEITADVVNFEMDGLSVNGIPLNLNIEVDDDELTDQVTELLDAIEELDDGTGELFDGLSDLQDAAQSDLKDGVSQLKDGTSQLYSGAAELQDGGTSLQNGAAELQSGAVSLDEGIQSLNTGIGQIQTALNALNARSAALTNGSAEFRTALGQLQSALNSVSVSSEDLSALVTASSSIKSGIDHLVSGITAFQQNVSAAAYKAAMSQNGLDIDGLKQNNEAAVGSVNSLIADLQSQAAVLKEAGQDTSALENQISQLSNITALLQANNAAITGTESYLTMMNENLAALSEGAANLQTSYAAFDATIAELANTLGSLAYQMSSLASAVNSLVSAYEELNSGIAEYTNAVAQIAAGYSQISNGAAQLAAGSSSLVAGSQTLYSGTEELVSGIDELYDGAGSLCDGTVELDEGVDELLDGIAQLYDGAGELKDGTSEFREKTEGMDTEISDKIDDLIEGITGGDLELHSFVSSKNTEVRSVQFVIQTEGIRIEEAEEAVAEEAEPLNVWEKLLRLFGLY